VKARLRLRVDGKVGVVLALRSFADLRSAQAESYLLGREWLTSGAPESRAGAGGLFAAFDTGAALAAGFAATFVDPEIFLAVGAAGGAAESGVRDDLVAGIVGDASLQIFPRGADEAGELDDAESGDFAERVYVAGEAEFGFEDIADAGEDRLGEKGFGDFCVVMCAEAAEDFGVVVFGGEDVGAELIEALAATERVGGVEFGDGDVEGDSVDLRRSNEDAHVEAMAFPFFVGAVDVPAAGHEHVGEEDEVAGEMDEEPFSVGFDFFDGAAGDGRVDFDAFEFGEDGFERGDGLIGERAMERAGGAEDCVAFRHGERVDSRQLKVEREEKA
jgi:hypothetical protein